MDVANTMMNWLDYTQLVYREKGTIGIPDEKRKEDVYKRQTTVRKCMASG